MPQPHVWLRSCNSVTYHQAAEFEEEDTFFERVPSLRLMLYRGIGQPKLNCVNWKKYDEASASSSFALLSNLSLSRSPSCLLSK